VLKNKDIKKLENWYEKYHRDLPFRLSKDPYTIWVSEIMLQQTQVDTVVPYFNAFIEKYPNIHTLAQISEEDLLRQVQGLGYYRRFKLMLKAAKIMESKYQGVFPKTYQEVKSLPGIGDYTAGAIMSIAYNQPYSAIDGNVIRVLSRVYKIQVDMRLEKNKKIIKSINQGLIEQATPYIYTQALMELGALICKPTNPICHLCPLNDACLAYHQHIQEQLPKLSKKPKKKDLQLNTFIITHNNSIYLRKRTQQLLEGMYEFPQYEGQPPFTYQLIEELGHIHHHFTHLVWTMNVYKVTLTSKPPKDFIEVPVHSLSEYPMATAHKKIANLI